jgi:diadenosine tetraphosphatase ApaH/serine/threonine PP2A family protein phosphatase
VRVAVVSDIHANLVALDAVLADAGHVDAVWHLGDVVGYGPDPDGVVARLAEIGATGVAGNHDRAATGALDIDWFNDDARAAIVWTQHRIAAATATWLAALPDTRTEAGILLVHGSPRDPTWEYILTAAIARESFEHLATPLGLYGHTHLPMAWTLRGSRVGSILPDDAPVLALAGSDRVLVNPGSVGQPRDGDPRAGWLELDTDAGEARWHRVTYDIAAVQAEMRAAGLPIRLIDRIRVGL